MIWDLLILSGGAVFGASLMAIFAGGKHAEEIGELNARIAKLTDDNALRSRLIAMASRDIEKAKGVNAQLRAQLLGEIKLLAERLAADTTQKEGN